MRSLNPTLLTAMDTGNYDPYFLATIQDNYDGRIFFSGQPIGYELSDLELVLTIQSPVFIDLPFYRTSVVLTRGITQAGSQYTISTSKFTIISSTWDGNFQMFHCHLIPRVYYSAPGDLTYQQVITAFCANFGKTAVFLVPGAAWLGWQFLPTGKSVLLNNAQTFFQQLKQKYFIFACDNGSDQILFYTAFTHVAAPQYSITGYRFDVDYNVDQRRQYMWRDENETVHNTVPSFAYSVQPDAGVQAILSMVDLGSGVVLAGSYKNADHGGKIFRSTDYGLTWDAGFDLYPNRGVYSLLNLGSGIILASGYYYGFILRSTDYGVTWSDVFDFGVDTSTSLVDCGNGIVLAGHTNPAQVWRSTDYGLTWTVRLTPGGENAVYAICNVGNGVCLTCSSPGCKIYRSTNYGLNWTLITSLAENNIYSLVNLGNGIVLLGTSDNGKIYKSIDAGLNWSLVYTLPEAFVFTLNAMGSGVVLAGTGMNGRVYRSVDFGVTWTLIQVLGTESSIRSFITLGNGSTLAGTGEHALIYKSLNCVADLDVIHNLGFLPSAASEPSAYFLLAQPKFAPFLVHLKYQSSDFIRVNLAQGGIYDFTCAQVTEILDLSQKSMPFRQLINQTPWLTNTASGPLPGTIVQVAAYTPLVTANFDDILTVYDNNLQSAMDRLDDHHHGAQLYNFMSEKGTPDDADLFALVDSLTSTHLTRKIQWSELKSFFTDSMFGDGADGDVVINADTSLSGDMFYNNLTVNVGVTLNTNGYIVKVKGTLWNKGTIACNGGDGGSGASGGAAGVIATSHKNHFNQGGIGGAGAAGGVAGTLNGAAGSAGTSFVSVGYMMLPQRSGGAGGGGGNHGSVAVNGSDGVAVFAAYAGGAGGAGTGATSLSLTGGGGGAGGGGVEIWCGVLNNAGVISANGGSGGNGQYSGATKAGNGGGGGGGIVAVYYVSVTGSGVGTVQSLAGPAGTGGNGGAAGTAGSVVTMQI